MPGHTISAALLKDGDVLLYQGTGLTSRLIRLFDGGDYSHAAIYHSGHVTEVLGDGVTKNSVGSSAIDAKYVDVYRFFKNGAASASVSYPISPLDTAITYSEKYAQRYAYDPILLLALLASTRKLTAVSRLPGLAMIVRNILEAATEAVASMVAAGREPVICSELVYRSFKNADGAGKYELFIKAPDASALTASTEHIGITDLSSAAEFRELQARAADFLLKYAAAKRANHNGRASMNGAPPTVDGALVDFVTPNDLQASPNLQLAGTLQL